MYALVISETHKSSWTNTVEAALRALHGASEIRSPHDAIPAVLVNDYDVILVDANQPDIDVADVTSALHRRKPRIPILVATMSPTWQRARKILLAGAADYVRKSLDNELVQMQILEVIERYQSNQWKLGEPDE